MVGLFGSILCPSTAVVSILLYGCTAWMLTKHMEEKLDGNYTRMVGAILHKSKRKQLAKQQLYGYQSPILESIEFRRTEPAGHCWRSKDDLINDILLRTPSYGRASVGRPAKTFPRQLCTDTGCSLEDLPETMDNGDQWRYIYIYIYIEIERESERARESEWVSEWESRKSVRAVRHDDADIYLYYHSDTHLKSPHPVGPKIP